MTTERSISPEATRVKLTFGQIASILTAAAFAAIAYSKTTTVEDVQKLAAEASSQALAAASAEHLQTRARLETRLDTVERASEATNAELRALNARMERLLTLVSVAVAQSAEASPRARETARRVREQMQRGEDPLALPPD